MVEFRTPTTIGTILNAPLVTIQGTVTDLGTVTVAAGTLVVAGGTVSTLQSLSNVAVASLVGSLGSPVAIGGGTISTLQSQSNIAVASLVGSIGSPVIVGGGTISTLQSLANLAAASLVGYAGTVGTILSPSAVNQLFPPTGVIATTSATIRGASGTLYGMLVSNQSTVAATVLVYAFPGTVGNGTIAWPVQAAPNGLTQWTLDRGLAYTGSLVASILGTVSALFLT